MSLVPYSKNYLVHCISMFAVAVAVNPLLLLFILIILIILVLNIIVLHLLICRRVRQWRQWGMGRLSKCKGIEETRLTCELRARRKFQATESDNERKYIKYPHAESKVHAASRNQFFSGFQQRVQHLTSTLPTSALLT